MAPKDVFISHRGPDSKRSFCAILSKALERQKITCFLDDRSLRIGDSAMATIAEALDAARVVIFVLSEHFFDSEHCMNELHQCRISEKNVVPVYFGLSPDASNPDNLMRSMLEVDWSKFQGGLPGWQEDVKWIRSFTGIRLVDLNAVDGYWDSCIEKTVASVARLLGRPAREPSKSPFAGFVPPRNLNFVGRKSELEKITTILKEQADAESVGAVFVSGLGGMGKTQLLVEYLYANRIKQRYEMIAWVDGSSQGRVASYLTTLSEHLGVVLEGKGPEREAENISRVRNALEMLEAPCLLVLDNVDDEAGLWDLLPRVGLCQVLISTRLSRIKNMRGFTLSILEEQDALKLLSGNLDIFLVEELAELAKRLGFLTLALAVSSNIIADGTISPKELLRLLDEKGATIFERGATFSEQELEDPTFKKCPDLVQLFNISLELVRKGAGVLSEERAGSLLSCFCLGKMGRHSPICLAERMLQVGGWYANAPIPLNLLQGVAKQFGGGSDQEQEGSQALGLLVRYGLAVFNPQDGSVSFHELVQEYGRHLGGQIAGRAMIAILKEVGLQVKLVPHFHNACLRALPSLNPDIKPILHLQSQEVVALIEAIALPLVSYYMRAGTLAAGKVFLNLDVEGLPEQLKATCLAEQATLLLFSGEYVKALPLYNTAISIREEVLGPFHPLVASTWRGRGCLFASQGRYDVAMLNLERAIRIYELGSPPNLCELAATLSEAADVLWYQEKLDEALFWSTKAMRIIVDGFGAEHPFLEPILNRMGGILRSQGKYEEALPIFKAALRLKEKELGPENPSVAGTLGGLANLYENMGENHEALRLLQRALSIEEGKLEKDHPDVATTATDMATVLMGLKRHDEALPLFERAIRIREQKLGPRHPKLAISLNGMASLLAAKGRDEEAYSMYARAVLIFENGPTPSHSHLAASLQNMAPLLKKQGEYEKALALYRRALHIQEEQLGIMHPYVAATLVNMGSTLEELGQYDGALRLYQRALAIRKKSFRPCHPNIINTLRWCINAELLKKKARPYCKFVPSTMLDR